MKGETRTIVVCMFLLASALVPAVSALAEGSEDPGVCEAPDVLFEGYEVSVLDAYAVTEVRRVLQNPSSEPLNWTFMFRIPEGALISNFSIEVEGVTFFADVLEKVEAEEKYNQAVSMGFNAGLVASRGDRYFDYRVSFMPDEEMTATVRYEQVLLKQNGWYEYELPIGDGREPTEVDLFQVAIGVEAPTEIGDVTTTGYDDLVRRDRPDTTHARVSVREDDYSPEDDLVVRWSTAGGPAHGTMYFGEHGGMGYFVHVYDPDPALLGPSRMAKDFVFVMDKSGSMSGVKFNQSKEALEHIYGTLSSEDRFSFVEFSGSSEVYSPDLLPADQERVARILHHIKAMEIAGSTNIHSAVVDALNIFKQAGRTVPVVVLLTDGQANTGLYARSEFRQDVASQNTVDASFFCIALGSDADWSFLEALSLENDGRAIWVQEDEDVVAMITDFVAGFSSPLLANMRFEYNSAVTDVHPSDVRAHFEGSEVLVAGRFPLGTPLVEMSLLAISPDGSYTVDGVFPVDVSPGHDFVPRFWAFSRIRDLLDRVKYNGTDDATIEEITDLAIEFHFATDYTSLFVELPEEVQQRFYPGEGLPTQPGITESPDTTCDHSITLSASSYKNSGSGKLGGASGSSYSGGSGSSYDSAPRGSSGDGGALASSPAEEEDSVLGCTPLGSVILVMLAIAAVTFTALIRRRRRRRGNNPL